MHRIHFLLGTPLLKYFPFFPMPTVDSSGAVDFNQRTIFLREPPDHVWRHLGCHNSGKRPGMLLNTLNAQDNPPQEKCVQSHLSAVLWLRNTVPASSRRTQACGGLFGILGKIATASSRLMECSGFLAWPQETRLSLGTLSSSTHHLTLPLWSQPSVSPVLPIRSFSFPQNSTP